MELLRYELYKIYKHKIIWIAYIFFFIVTIFFVFYNSDRFISNLGDLNDFYRSTYLGKEGTVTAEMLAAAQKEQDQLFAETESLYKSNSSIPQETLRRMAFVDDVITAAQERDESASYLTELQEAAQTALRESGENSFAYRDAALHLEMARSVRESGLYFPYSWGDIIDFPVGLGFLFSAAMILLGLSPIFSEEYATGADALLLSSRRGKRQSARAKIAAGVLYCIATDLFFTLVNMAGNFIVRGFYGGDAPLQTIQNYVLSPYSFTIAQYFSAETLVSLFGCICFGLLVMLVSSLSGNALVPFFICGCLIGTTGIVIASHITLSAPLSWLADFSYTELMRVKDLFTVYKSYSVFGYPVLYLPLALVIFVIVSAAVLLLTLRAFRKHQVKSA